MLDINQYELRGSQSEPVIDLPLPELELALAQLLVSQGDQAGHALPPRIILEECLRYLPDIGKVYNSSSVPLPVSKVLAEPKEGGLVIATIQSTDLSARRPERNLTFTETHQNKIFFGQAAVKIIDGVYYTDPSKSDDGVVIMAGRVPPVTETQPSSTISPEIITVKGQIAAMVVARALNRMPRNPFLDDSTDHDPASREDFMRHINDEYEQHHELCSVRDSWISQLTKNFDQWRILLEEDKTYPRFGGISLYQLNEPCRINSEGELDPEGKYLIDLMIQGYSLERLKPEDIGPEDIDVRLAAIQMVTEDKRE